VHILLFGENTYLATKIVGPACSVLHWYLADYRESKCSTLNLIQGPCARTQCALAFLKLVKFCSISTFFFCSQCKFFLNLPKMNIWLKKSKHILRLLLCIVHDYPILASLSPIDWVPTNFRLYLSKNSVTMRLSSLQPNPNYENLTLET